MTIDAVLSDLGNVAVLFDNDRAVRAFVTLTGRSERDVRDVLLRKGGALLRRFERGDVSATEFRRTVCVRLGLTKRELPPDADFDAAYADVFTPNDEVLARWRLMRAAGKTVVAVSNIDPVREARLARDGLLAGFDHLVMSWSEGLRKPSAELMVRALDRAGAAAERTIFVDDIAENLAPAARLGIVTHRYVDIESLDGFLEEHGA